MRGALFEKAGKIILQTVKILNCSDLVDGNMVLPVCICKFDAKDIPDASKHISDVF